MIEICKLSKQKGFDPKTLSTSWVFEHHTNGASGFKLNDTCDYLLLYEIQIWAREKLDKNIEIISHKYKTKQLNNLPRTFKYKTDKGYSENYNSYREALEAGLKEILK